jgi:hypothetical protein
LFAQSANKEPAVKAPRGSISGRVKIKDKPARGVTVGLRKSALMSASDVFTKTVTDAEGNYRLSDVPAGSYLVTVAAPAFINPDVNEYKSVVVSEGENVDDINFSLVRGGVITGKVTDGEGRPVIVQQVFILPADSVGTPRPPQGAMNAQTDDRGIYRVYGVRPGRYKVAAGQGDEQTGIYVSSQSRYKRVFHPDVSDAAKATVIEVTEGSEASKVDITLGSVMQTYSVSGRIINGETNAGMPSLTFTLRALVGQRFAFGRTDARGEFVLEGVAAGKYDVMMAPDNSEFRADALTVEVIDRDVTDVTLKLTKGLRVTGVVVLETQDKAARGKLSEMTVQGSVRPATNTRYGSSSTSPIAADGSFTLKGLMKGRLELSLSSFGSAYPLKGFAISRIERDGVLAQRIELQEGQDLTGLKIVVGYGTAVVRGVVNVENGPLPEGARIFVRLSRPGDTTSFARNVAADERGRFVIEGILPGEYEITAVVGGMPKQPKPVKQPVSLADGVTTEVNLAIDLAVPATP